MDIAKKLFKFLSGAQNAQEEEPTTENCGLCGRVENTMHLLFECSVYAEAMWALLQQGINAVLQQDGEGRPGVTLHAYNIMYNSYIMGLPKEYTVYHILIQEIKRNMVYRRFNRVVHNVGTRIDQHRIHCHLAINVKKLIDFRKYQGMEVGPLNALLQVFEDMI